MFRIILLASTLLCLAASAARACTCSNGGPRTAFRASEAVFLGRVVDISARRPGRFGAELTARLVVTQGLKGVRRADTVAVEYEDNSCSPGFVVGGRFLVYADTIAGLEHLGTSHCTGTKPASCAGNDLRALGVRPRPGTQGTCIPAPVIPRGRDTTTRVGAPRPAT